MSTFTTRFIFPMISLEGRRFWILGLLPVKRDAILWSKFLFAAMISLIPCSLLILLSDAMLQISWLVIAIHQLVCVILCVGLSGIAVGLGATIPDLREQSPSKIAAGFGGTLNLVLSAIYILLVVLLTALPCHFFLAWRESAWAGTWLAALLGGTLLSVAIGVAATLVPMRMGLAAFRKMETLNHALGAVVPRALRVGVRSRHAVARRQPVALSQQGRGEQSTSSHDELDMSSRTSPRKSRSVQDVDRQAVTAPLFSGTAIANNSAHLSLSSLPSLSNGNAYARAWYFANIGRADPGIGSCPCPADCTRPTGRCL